MGIASRLNAEAAQGPAPGTQQAYSAAPSSQQHSQPAYPPIFQAAPSAPVNSYPQVNYQQAPFPAVPQAQASHGASLGPGAGAQAAPQGAPLGGPAGQGGSFYSADAIQNKLWQLVVQNNLHTFYSQARVAELARTVSQINFAQLAERWRLPPQMALDLVGLALYDTVIMVDDSASMRFAEGGERINDMKAILERISSVCGLLDTDGISVHTMNGHYQQDHIRYSQQAADFVRQIAFEGATPLGTMIQQKLLDPYIYLPAKQRALRKPVHVIVITDGEPTGESSGQVRTAIARCKDFLKSGPYGAGGAAFQFAQVGLDQRAQAFLAKLDNDTKVGKMVDCTSAYELEQEEYKKRSGIDLTPDMYLNKLCLGAIDRSYDEQDESAVTKKKGFFKRLLN